MAARPFLSPSEVAEIEATRQQGFATAKLLWRDTYTIRRTTREAGWDAGTDPEDVTEPESGLCKLIAAGPGPGNTADAVIVGLSPYRAKLDATTTLDPATDLIVINGREFLVNDVARGDVGRTIVEASISERNGGGAAW